MQDYLQQIENYYKDYPEKPFISEKRDFYNFLKEVEISKSKLVPKTNMVRTEDNLLPGDIILLWRINFGTFTTESIKEGMYPKYFEYSYGIDAPKNLKKLVEDGYALINDAIYSLYHNPVSFLKILLKEKEVKGLSKMKKEDVHKAILENFSEEELIEKNLILGYSLTPKGEETLLKNNFIVDKHPKKKF